MDANATNPTEAVSSGPSAGASKPRMCFNHPDEPAVLGEPFCSYCLMEDLSDDADETWDTET